MFRFKSALRYALLLWMVQFGATAQGAYVSDHVNVQRSAQRELDRIRHEQQQRRILQQQYQPLQASEQPTFQGRGQSCLDYQQLLLVGKTRVDIEALLPRAGECLNADRLNQLSRDITTAYLNKGYLHQSLAFEPKGQILYLRITEGVVRSISGADAIVNPQMLFPGLQGDALNIHRLDQGLDHTNRFLSNRVTVDVLPQEDGNIDLLLRNTSAGRASGYIALDNSGSQGTGQWVARTGLIIDSPFALSDSLTFSASHSFKNRHFDPYSRSLAFQYSVPYGYWDFSVFGSISQYRTALAINNNQYELDGRTWQAGGRVNYVFSRGSNHVSSIYGQLERIAARGRFEKSVIYLQSPSIVNAQLGWSHLQVMPSGVLMSDVGFEQGLPWVSGYADEYKKAYRKVNLNLNAQFHHRSGQTLWRHNHELIAQYSPDFLPTIKQLELLDRYAIRGLGRYSAAAEKGAVLRNNLYLSVSRGDWDIEPYVGFDIGVIKPTPATDTVWGHSWSVGLKLNHRQGAEARVEFSKGRFKEDRESLSDSSLSLKLMYWF
ncbi:hemin-binding protein [Advenella kashmirensis W13003]|uniref:Hemin-binding protein n=1 Tax=Advenella kashmirensis W13003 TaxID=1424334 RepID=V8QRE7_9BURK|nr:ShlB/FhaC/HecB family hemolysin secretion/activation protein [Advenella kashmirensis]ETF01900.1 hemin-binding protein [Advenella kashmirensis W13003]